MAQTEDIGGYLTRGRAGEVFRRLDEMDAATDERLRLMEERIEDLVAFELELIRRRIAVEIDLVRSFPTTRGDAWQRRRSG